MYPRITTVGIHGQAGQHCLEKHTKTDGVAPDNLRRHPLSGSRNARRTSLCTERPGIAVTEHRLLSQLLACTLRRPLRGGEHIQMPA